MNYLLTRVNGEGYFLISVGVLVYMTLSNIAEIYGLTVFHYIFRKVGHDMRNIREYFGHVAFNPLNTDFFLLFHGESVFISNIT